MSANSWKPSRSTLDAMLEALDNGEITDAKTVAALFFYARQPLALMQ